MTKLDELREWAKLIVSLTEEPPVEPPIVEPPVVEPEPPVEPPVPPIIVNPPLSEWTRPEPIPRSDYMAIPTGIVQEVYISPAGHENGTGTMSNPYLTLDHAFQVIQNRAFAVSVRFKRGGTYVSEKGSWFKSGNHFYDLDKPVLFSAYGEGELPILDFKGGGFAFEGSLTKKIEGWYFQNLRIRNGGFFIWDNVRHMVWDNVHIEGAGLGYNISGGRVENPDINFGFAILNSSQQDCPQGGIFSGAADLYIDNNLAQRNGTGWSHRNYYLGGNNLNQTKNVTLQRSKSFFNSPVDGHGGPSPHYTTHGYIDGLNIIDNEFTEVPNTSDSGCWGVAVDEGRTPDWGQEKFPNAVVTGNKISYTGNQNISISAAVNPLIGWNELHINNSARGIGLPGKPHQASDYFMATARVVHNKLYVPDDSIGMVIDGVDAVMEYNQIIKQGANAKGIVKDGVELAELGTNTYINQY